MSYLSLKPEGRWTQRMVRVSSKSFFVVKISMLTALLLEVSAIFVHLFLLR